MLGGFGDSAGVPVAVVDELPDGVVPLELGEVPDGDVVPPVPGCGVGTDETDESILPSMTGRPSLTAPITTTFALGDSASATVAAIPCQRRYESEIPSLTVRWKAAMPFASICLRLDSSTSRSARYLYSVILYCCSVWLLIAATIDVGNSMLSTSV